MSGLPLGAVDRNGHVEQYVAPLEFWNVPTAHCEQRADPFVGLNVPGWHARQKLSPFVNPGLHEHSSIAALPGIDEESGGQVRQLVPPVKLR
eukprot:3430299-Rhodomonas_salina.1